MCSTIKVAGKVKDGEYNQYRPCDCGMRCRTAYDRYAECEMGCVTITAEIPEHEAELTFSDSKCRVNNIVSSYERYYSTTESLRRMVCSLHLVRNKKIKSEISGSRKTCLEKVSSVTVTDVANS